MPLLPRSIENERIYARLFAKYYQTRPKQGSGNYVKVMFTDGQKNITINNVSKVERVGGARKKPDVRLYYYENGSKRIFDVSVKTNDSIFWGSDDKYIRGTLGAQVRKIFKTKENELFQLDVTGKITTPRMLLEPVGFEIPEAVQKYSMFGEGNNKCDIVVRGNMNEQNAFFDTKENLITFRVTKIYQTVNDALESDRPMLLAYNATNRVTFNIPPEDDELPDREFTDYRGIRGRISTGDSVTRTVERDNIFSIRT